MNLQERQGRYGVKFTDKQTFRGALHCKAGLASILDKTTREDFTLPPLFRSESTRLRWTPLDSTGLRSDLK